MGLCGVVRSVARHRTEVYRSALRPIGLLGGRSALFLPVWLVIIVGSLAGVQAGTGTGPTGVACTAAGVGFVPNSAPLQITFNTFSKGINAWPQNAVGACGLLFAALVGFQIIWTAVILFLRNEGSIAAMVNGLIAELLRLYIPIAIFTQLPAILFAFFNAMLTFGANVTATAPPAELGTLFGGFQPSYFAAQGSCLAGSLLADIKYVFTANQGSWLNPGPAIQAAVSLIPCAFSAFVVGGCYVIIAYAFYFLALEVYIIAGFVPLSFVLFGTRATQGIPSGLITQLFALGMKVAALSALAAFGGTLATTWSDEMITAALTGEPLTLFLACVSVCLGAVTYALLVLFLPMIIKNTFGGGPALTVGAVFNFARSASQVISPAFAGGGGGGGPVPVVIVGNAPGGGGGGPVGAGSGGVRPGPPPPNTVSGKP
jgi:hypothetical protein